eukprot:1012164-Heterocapsa_arctica.AAC.1
MARLRLVCNGRHQLKMLRPYGRWRSWTDRFAKNGRSQHAWHKPREPAASVALMSTDNRHSHEDSELEATL